MRLQFLVCNRKYGDDNRSNSWQQRRIDVTAWMSEFHDWFSLIIFLHTHTHAQEVDFQKEIQHWAIFKIV